MIKPYQCEKCLLYMKDDFCKHFQGFIILPKDFDCEYFEPSLEYKKEMFDETRELFLDLMVKEYMELLSRLYGTNYPKWECLILND